MLSLLIHVRKVGIEEGFKIRRLNNIFIEILPNQSIYTDGKTNYH